MSRDRLVPLPGVALVAALIVATAPAVLGQWAPHTTPGVPRLPDGKPDLNAPAPRPADGRPDLSGIWEVPGGFGRNDTPPAPPAGTPPVAYFWNAGAGFPNDLPFQPWAADLKKKRIAEESKDNPDALCLPMGFMQFHTHPQPRKMVQTRDLLVIIYEVNYGLRQIFLDGRKPVEDPQPWWYGYSTARWEGDTLVVETTNFKDDIWLDVNGSPLTGAARVTERFRRPNFGNLEIDITVDDPKAYTQPWTVRVNQRIMVDSDLIEFICHENQQFGTRVKID
jgi:hypothetical protein